MASNKLALKSQISSISIQKNQDRKMLRRTTFIFNEAVNKSKSKTNLRSAQGKISNSNQKSVKGNSHFQTSLEKPQNNHITKKLLQDILYYQKQIKYLRKQNQKIKKIINSQPENQILNKRCLVFQKLTKQKKVIVQTYKSNHKTKTTQNPEDIQTQFHIDNINEKNIINIFQSPTPENLEFQLLKAKKQIQQQRKKIIQIEKENEVLKSQIQTYKQSPMKSNYALIKKLSTQPTEPDCQLIQQNLVKAPRQKELESDVKKLQNQIINIQQKHKTLKNKCQIIRTMFSNRSDN